MSSAKRSLHKEDLSKSPITIVLLRKKNLLGLFCHRNPSQKGLFSKKKKSTARTSSPENPKIPRERDTHQRGQGPTSLHGEPCTRIEFSSEFFSGAFFLFSLRVQVFPSIFFLGYFIQKHICLDTRASYHIYG